MFNDERINSVSGKIYRNGISIATVIATVYLILKIISLVVRSAFSFSHLISEVFTVIAGASIILIGELRLLGEEKDERFYLEKYTFYIKAAKHYLVIVLLGFAVAIPFEFSKPVNIMPLNFLLIHLQIIGLIYFSYCFKKNEIYYNYTFIEETGWNYYKKVVINILKLLLMLLTVYAISLVISFMLYINYDLTSLFLLILVAFIFSFVSLGLIYFFISWVEKVSFNEEIVDRNYSVTSLIIGIVVILLFVGFSYYGMKNQLMIINGLDKTYNGKTIGEVIADNSTMIKYFGYYYYAFYGLLLAHLLTQVKGKKTCEMGIKIMLISIVINIFINFINLSTFSIITASYDIENFQKVSRNFHYITNSLSFIGLVGQVILFMGFIGELRIKEDLILIQVIALFMNFLFPFIRGLFPSKLYIYITYPISLIFFVLFILTIISVKNNNNLDLDSY